MSEDIENRIIDATMALAASKGWMKLSMHDIAAEAKVSLADLYRRAPAKHTILCRLSERVNRTVLARVEADMGETPRERLFEVLMSRFDALQPFKPGLKAISSDLPWDPAAAAIMAMLLPPSMAWMLEAAGIDVTGMSAPLKVAVLTTLYLRVLKVWMNDTNENGGKTMAELDRLLKQAEGWANSFGRNRV